MKNWEVIKNGEVINIIVADDEFAAKYSKATGYELRYIEPEPEPIKPTEEEPTEAEDTSAMLIDHEYRLTLLELGLSEY